MRKKSVPSAKSKTKNDFYRVDKFITPFSYLVYNGRTNRIL